MPILAPSNPVAPNDPVELVLEFARVIANDCELSLAGNLLSDNQPGTFTMLKLAWRKFQRVIGNNSIEELPEEFILSNVTALPASVAQDPGTQAYISYSEYWDGLNDNPSPVLPQDLFTPLTLWERPTGQNAQFILMAQATDGLPSRVKGLQLIEWEWRRTPGTNGLSCQEAIYLVGATQANDIRVRYKRIIPDPDTDDLQGNAPIPIVNCADVLAYYVVEIFATARGSLMLPKITQERQRAVMEFINNTSRKKQRANYRRQPYSERRRMGGWTGL